MFEILILVCASSVKAPDCQTNTALDVMHGPVVSSVITCGLQGQAYVAQTSLASRLDGAYLKIRCGYLKSEEADADGPRLTHRAQ